MIPAVVRNYNFFYMNDTKSKEYENKKVTALFWQVMFVKQLINIRLQRMITVLP